MEALLTPLLHVAIGFVLGAVVWAPVFEYLRRELAYYRKELATAQDRLVHAWRDDKAIIPPRPVEIRPPTPLPADLLEVVNEWESPETRAQVESQIREMYDKGHGVQAILMHMQNVGLKV